MCVGHEKRVLFLFTTSVRNIIRSGKYLATYARDARNTDSSSCKVAVIFDRLQ
jgi:hypothetical protein